MLEDMDQEEISEKIRKAIKAKLTELGSYIDDELPDYIMVMIANKKDVKQMASDLELFLGETAEPFTKWLDSLLTRLQSIAQSAVKAETKKTPTPTKSAEVTPQQSVKSAPADIESKEETTTDAAMLTLHAPEDEITFDDDDDYEPLTRHSVTERPATSTPLTTKGTQQTDKSSAKTSGGSTEKAMTRDLLAERKRMISTRGDSESLIPKAAVQPSPRTTSATAQVSSSSTGAQAAQSASNGRRSQSPVHRRKSPDRAAPVRPTASSRLGNRPDVREGREHPRHRDYVDRRDEHRSRDSDRRDDSRLSDRRDDYRSRGLGRRDDRYGRGRYDDRDRPRRPVWQENRGRESRERSRERSPVAAGGLVSQIGSVVPRVEMVSDSSEDEYNPDEPQIGSVASIIQVSKRKSSIPEALQANKKLLLRAMADVTKSLGAPSLDVVQIEEKNAFPAVKSQSSKRTSAKVRVGVSARERLGRRSGDDVRMGRSPDHKRRFSRSKSRSRSRSRSRSKLDSVEEFDEEDLLEMLKQVQERKRMRGKQDVQSIDLKRKDSAGKRRPISERINFEKREMVDESVSSPKFVVTLDGVADMSKLLPQKSLDDDDDIDLLDDTLDSDLADMKAEIRGSLDFSTPSKVGEEAKNLSNILCRLLPNCRAGRRCPFMHPPCKNFPNCKFGDQCVYTHPTSAAPPCKFDGRCTKPRCPFTHSVKVHNPGMVLAQLSKAPLPLPTKPVGKTVCKFHPKCSNMDCQYLHPKPCRFGLSCAKRNKGCIFTHPSLPTKSQLKWTKSSLGISDQEG